MRRPLALVFLVGLAASAAAGTWSRIVGGIESTGFPSAGALLQGTDAGSADSWCSGVLVGCRTFLTAAHCVCDATGRECQQRSAVDPGTRFVYLQHAGFFAVESIAVHPDFEFPANDVAVLRLAVPVTGVAPAPLAETAPPVDTAGTIVGFGRTGGTRSDYGIKRQGSVELSACESGLGSERSLCWHYDGSGANTCGGDSGGPLFVDVAGRSVVAGLTSGGSSSACLSGDDSFDTSVAAYRPWILGVSGDDVASTNCGAESESRVELAGQLRSAERVGEEVAVDVGAESNELRVAVNGIDDGVSDFDVYVKQGRSPTHDDYDCASTGAGQYSYCQILFPAQGRWYVRIERAAGGGPFQLVASTVDGPPPVCGNGQRESGEACDGADAAACAGACAADCTCGPPPCATSGLKSRLVRVAPRFELRARMEVDESAGSLDPTRLPFVLRLGDGLHSEQISIPAGDPGWKAGKRKRFVWRGVRDGVRRIDVRDRRARAGGLRIVVRGRRVVKPPLSRSAALGVRLTLGGLCVEDPS